MRRALFWELKNSPFLVAGPALAASQIALMLGALASWRGVWPMALANLGAQLIYIAPVVAALAALDTLRRGRRLAKVLGGEGARMLAVLLLAQMVWALAPVAAGLVCAAAVNVAVGAPSGWVGVPYLVLAAVFVVEAAAFGHLLGAFGGPLWFAPVTALLAMFIRVVLAGSAGVGWAATFTRLAASGPPWKMVAPGGLVSAVAEVGVVVVLALALPGVVGRLRARLRGRVLPAGLTRVGLAGAGLLGVVAGCVVVFNGAPVIVDRPAPDEGVCTDTATRVCVWPESAVHLPQLAAMADRAGTVAGALGVAPAGAMYEMGLDPDASTFTMVNSTTWFMSGTLASDIAWQVEAPTCQLEPKSSAAEQADGIRRQLAAMIRLMLEDSVRPAGMGDTSGLDWPAIEAVWEDGEGAVNAWIDRRIDELRAVNAVACQ
jgi:hypothetical protein